MFEKAQYCKVVNPPQTGLYSKYDQNLNRIFFFLTLWSDSEVHKEMIRAWRSWGVDAGQYSTDHILHLDILT